MGDKDGIRYWIGTFLSKRDEWESLALGVGIGALLIHGFQSFGNAVVAAGLLLGIAFLILPEDIENEWHYWGGAVSVILLFILLTQGLDVSV